MWSMNKVRQEPASRPCATLPSCSTELRPCKCHIILCKHVPVVICVCPKSDRFIGQQVIATLLHNGAILPCSCSNLDLEHQHHSSTNMTCISFKKGRNISKHSFTVARQFIDTKRTVVERMHERTRWIESSLP